MRVQAVIFNTTVICDGHPSLAATSMTTAQMFPTLETLESLGFVCLETWGGGAIDAGLRVLNEFLFDLLDQIRNPTKTGDMMPQRGQDVVSYGPCPRASGSLLEQQECTSQRIRLRSQTRTS